jgi:hypothetical protein
MIEGYAIGFLMFVTLRCNEHPIVTYSGMPPFSGPYSALLGPGHPVAYGRREMCVAGQCGRGYFGGLQGNASAMALSESIERLSCRVSGWASRYFITTSETCPNDTPFKTDSFR